MQKWSKSSKKVQWIIRNYKADERNTASLSSGRAGGPPLGGLKINSTNSRTSALQNNELWQDFSACKNSSCPTEILWQFSIRISSLTQSTRIAVYKIATTTSDDWIDFKIRQITIWINDINCLETVYHGRRIAICNQRF